MAHLIEAYDANDLWFKALTLLQQNGSVSAPHGRLTKEVLNVTSSILKPQRRILSVVGRNLNPFFNLAETLWILCGSSDVRWISKFNSRLTKVADARLDEESSSGNFHGAYGERIRYWGLNRHSGRQTSDKPIDQLFAAYLKLYNSPDTRQAVISLWNPEFDNELSLDIPCNVTLAFKIRNNALHYAVFNRSNDVIFGLTSTNVIQFSIIAETLASWLGVEVGEGVHFSQSLHFYENNPFASGSAMRTIENALSLTRFSLYPYVGTFNFRHTNPFDFNNQAKRTYFEVARAFDSLDSSSQVSALTSLSSAVGRRLLPNKNEKPLNKAGDYLDTVERALMAFMILKTAVVNKKNHSYTYADAAFLNHTSIALQLIDSMWFEDWKTECLRYAVTMLSPVVVTCAELGEKKCGLRLKNLFSNIPGNSNGVFVAIQPPSPLEPSSVDYWFQYITGGIE